MPKKLDKRGVDLTLNTIIIAVLVILVLVVVVTFFLGGFTGLTNRIKTAFFQTTAGTDRVLAVQTCEQFCDQAKLLPKASQRLSAYCTQVFVIEGYSKKEGDEYNILFTCGESNNAQERLSIKTRSFEDLGVGCPEVSCR